MGAADAVCRGGGDIAATGVLGSMRPGVPDNAAVCAGVASLIGSSKRLGPGSLPQADIAPRIVDRRSAKAKRFPSFG